MNEGIPDTFRVAVAPDLIEDPELSALLRSRQEQLKADQYGETAYKLLEEVLDAIAPHVHLLPEEAINKIRASISRVKANL